MAISFTQFTSLSFNLHHPYNNTCLHRHHARSAGLKIFRNAINSIVNLTTSVTFLISYLILTHHPRSGIGVAALSCAACENNLCPSTETCTGGLTLDVCGCCQVCARVKNEICGGQFGILGRCDRDLHCFIHTVNGQPITGKEAGVCKGQELLCNDNCPSVYEPKLCPPDSFLMTSEMKPEDILIKHDQGSIDNTNKDNGDVNNNEGSDNNVFLLPEQISYCMCNDSVCELPVCKAGYSIHLVHIGTGHPGKCCNVYVCRQLEECQSIICPPIEEDMCPDDSVRISSKWTEDGCCEIQQGCTCRSVDMCEPLWCPEGFQVQITSLASRLPGSCCDKSVCVRESGLTCTFNGKEMKSGETWQVDKCKSCECRDGLKKCKDKVCKNLSCTWMVVPDGECCPVCRGCVSESGNLYNESAVWQENHCTSCTCKEGQAHCQSEMCVSQCTNPKYIPDQCCPVCSETCTLDCQFGLKVNVEGNTVCECQTAKDTCPPWEEEHCMKKCDYGYKLSRNGCMTCKCRKCPQLNCTKRCIHEHILNDEGCVLCKCKELPVPELISSNFEPEKIEGRSCMSWHGSRHENGESWNDGCRLCYCHNGAEMCSLIACPVPQCSNPLFRTGDCCPTCPGNTVFSPTRENELCESSQGQYYVEGETWKMDLCTHCICHRGIIMCETPSCPPVVCHHPIKPEGQCCAICRGSDIMLTPNHHHRHHQRCTSSMGILYKHSEVWRSTPCQSCVCRDGQINCYNQMCPPLSCNRTIQRKGYCCPTCVEPGKPKICTYGGVTYGIGEKWEGDNCTQCSCTNGQTLCSPLHCPRLECTVLIRKRNQCCPQCNDHAQLHSYTQFGIGTHKDNKWLNITELSKNKSIVDGNTVGITVLAVLVFVLSIIIFLLVLYLMTKSRQRQNSNNLENKGQMSFLPEKMTN